MTVVSSLAETYPITRVAARASLRMYFTILIPLVILFSTLNILHILNDSHALLMISPAVAAIITRLIRREGFVDISLQFGGRRGLVASIFAILFPVVAGILVYMPTWLLGLAHFAPMPFFLAKSVTNPVLQVVLWIITFVAIGAPALALATAGEELGWRGFMLTRLIDGGLPRPILLSGLVWALYHLPVILGGNYAHTNGNPFIAAFLFLFSAAAFASINAWLRLGTGSVWPCIIAHGAWNTIFDVGFDGNSKGGNYLVTESGILTIAVMIITALVLWHVFPPRVFLRTPQTPMQANTGSIPILAKVGYIGAGIFCLLSGLASFLNTGIVTLVTLVSVGIAFLLLGQQEFVWANLRGGRRVGVTVLGIVFLIGTLGYLVEAVTHVKL